MKRKSARWCYFVRVLNRILVVYGQQVYSAAFPSAMIIFITLRNEKSIAKLMDTAFLYY
jgi:hypothetical protein